MQGGASKPDSATVQGSTLAVVANGKGAELEFDTAELAELAELALELKAWTEENNLPWLSADDLFHQLDEHDEHRTWLVDFIERWEDAEDRA